MSSSITPTTASASPTLPSSSGHSNCLSKQEVALDDLKQVIASIGDLGIDWNEVAVLQPLDPEFQRLKKSVDIGQHHIIVDISNGPARPYTPPLLFIKRIFEVLHGVGHPGVERKGLQDGP